MLDPKLIDSQLNDLIEQGATKLPSVEFAEWRNDTYIECLSELGSKTYGENLAANISFLERAKLLEVLLPRLLDIAQNHFKLRVDKDDIYNVCRLVRPGDTSEGYRGHFDSHLFTLVTPIKIPDFKNARDRGQLHYFPKARSHPKNEIYNISKKLAFKRFNSESGFDQLSKIKTRVIDDFSDYQPLLFIGNTTFHGNSPVQVNSADNRMTILTHFFDPSPRYGIGNIMRKIRRR